MNIFYVGVIILFIIVGIYLTNKYYFNNKNKTAKDNEFIENKEFNKSKNIEGDLYLFYTNWCPHSKKTMEIWDEIRKHYSNPDFQLNFIKIDSEKDNELSNKFNVTEYPTIILVIDSKKYYYDANLEELTLSKFLSAVYDTL
tara:strand:- start:454 stop:879 length:426 start_codon:yes stop_codon:yes gene_type:complete